MLKHPVTSSVVVQGEKCRGVWQHWAWWRGNWWFVDSWLHVLGKSERILKGCKGCWSPHQCLSAQQLGTRKVAVVVRATGMHTLGHRGLLLVPVWWQGLLANTHILLAGSKGWGQLQEHWQLLQLWLSAFTTVTGGSCCTHRTVKTDERCQVSSRKCTARMASSAHAHGSGGQLQGFGWCVALTQLQSHGVAAYMFPGIWPGCMWKKRERLRYLALAIANTCGECHCNTSMRGSTLTFLSLGFYSCETCWICLLCEVENIQKAIQLLNKTLPRRSY